VKLKQPIYLSVPTWAFGLFAVSILGSALFLAGRFFAALSEASWISALTEFNRAMDSITSFAALIMVVSWSIIPADAVSKSEGGTL